MTPIIETTDLVRHFGDVEALRGISVAIDEGTVYGLLGPNGAGKTTLIRILTTLLRPTSGAAFVDGIDVCVDPVGVRSNIGLAGQTAAVDEFLTGRENLVMVGRLYGLSASEARRRADDVLERISLTDAARRQVGTYSGGMRRRLDLAASLVGRPRVLFLDEPTTGIDPRSRIELWQLIGEIVTEGATVLMTTQYLDEADRLADRIGVIDHGRLIADGSAEYLKALVGGEVVEVAAPISERDVVLGALAGISDDEPYVEDRTGHVCLAAPNGSRTLMAVVRALDAAGIEPHDLALREPTMDDVFLTLTGDIAWAEGEEHTGAIEAEVTP